MGPDFICEANLSSASFASSLHDVIGKDGGYISSLFHHGCKECTHKKHYRADLIAKGVPIQVEEDGVAQLNPEDVLDVDVPQVWYHTVQCVLMYL